MLGYIVVDIVTGGHSNDLAFEGIGSLLDPLRAGVLTVLLDESLELLGSTGLLAYSDYFAGLNLVRGNVHTTAVYSEVTMCHQLTGFAAGIGIAHTEHYIVQTTLQLLQQHLTGVALLALGSGVVSAELTLEDTIDELNLLLLSQLQALFRLLAAVLLGVAVGFLGVTKNRGGKAQSLASSQNGLSILSH